MAKKKKQTKPKKRKTFSLPSEGPLYDSMDDLAIAGDESLLGAPPNGQMPPPEMPTPEEARAHQLEMIRGVFAFEQLAWRGFKTILMSILFFGVGTSLAGGALGWAFPNYCRFIFDAFDRVDFKPWVGGLAHGLVWGALVGAIIGCIVVFSVAHYQSRSWKNLREQAPEVDA